MNHFESMDQQMQMLTPLITRTKIVVTAAVVVSLFPTDGFFGGMRRTRVDRDRAEHPASVLWVIVARVCDAAVAEYLWHRGLGHIHCSTHC